MTYNFMLSIILSVFWLTSSGIFDIFFLICGACSITLTVILYRLFIYISKQEFDTDLYVYKSIPNIYICVKNSVKLIADISKSSITLTNNIIVGKQINSEIIKTDMSHVKNDFHLMLTAHSITMTPGSITIHQEGRTIYIHYLYSNDR